LDVTEIITFTGKTNNHSAFPPFIIYLSKDFFAKRIKGSVQVFKKLATWAQIVTVARACQIRVNLFQRE
jgi:hypothetical protein